MATVYVAPAPLGDDAYSYAQAQNPATPWATPTRVIAGATAGDTALYQAGSYRAPSNGYSFNKLIINHASGMPAVWYSDPAYVADVARTGATLAAGSISWTAITFDGELRTTFCFDVAANAGNSVVGTWTQCTFTNALSRPVNISALRGTFTFSQSSFEGAVSTGGLVSSANLGSIASAPFSLSMTDVSLNLRGTSSNIVGVSGRRSTTPLSTVTFNLNHVYGSVAGMAGTGTAFGIQLFGIESAVVINSDLTISSDYAVSESYGIQVIGLSAAPADNPVITNNEIVFLSPAGHGIIVGASNIDSFMAGGMLTGNRVIGDYYPTSTPHGITIGQGTAVSAIGDVAENIYVGFLHSKTTSGSRRGSIAKDCYGPSYYQKGVTDFVVDNNTAIVTGRFRQRELGILAVAAQASVDCVACTISNNTVIVADATRIHALASIAGLAASPGTPQPCSFSNNIYIIPDTVDLSTALLFTYTGVIGAAANQTYAQWILNPEVSGDRVVQLPRAVIDSMILSPPPAEAIFHNDIWYTRSGAPMYADPSTSWGPK